MVLSKPDIMRWMKEGGLKIEPAPAPSGIKQVSVDLRLGRKFSVMKELPEHVSSVRVKPSLFESRDLWEAQREEDRFVLEPSEFVLAHTHETVTMPSDLVGLVEGRSSWARAGLGVHVTAPKIDPGFEGTITLEIYNVGKMKVELVAEEDTPAQLILLKLTTDLEEADLYGVDESDRFQFQSDPIPHGRGTSK